VGKVQVNVKLDEDLVHEVEKLVGKGYFKNKTEVLIHALKLVLRYYKAQELREKLEK
jgi:Arc/MetJ-type ribon-helix-helix transcriptional regulator